MVTVPARGGSELTVTDAAVATGVEDLTPVGAARSFPADAGRLFCFTNVSGGGGGTTVTHRWYYGERLMAEVELKVRGKRHRTYSSKKILASWTGAWTVVVTDPEDTILETLEFTVE